MNEPAENRNMPEIRRTGNDLAAPGGGASVLGEKRATLQKSGTVRGGIQVLIKRYAENETAVRIYDAGLAKGVPFKTIEREIMKALNMESGRVLTPKNPPYFTVRPDDFAVRENASRMRESFGEDRGEGRQIYRIPIVLPVDNWLQVLPHKFECYTGAGLKYWSEYDPDGKTRRCMTLAPLRKDPKAERYHKPFGGRKSIPREDNGGICDPDKCPQYQKGDCELNGRLLFLVPGVIGGGIIQSKTSSFYGMDQMRSTMLTTLAVRGRFSGMHNGQPMFFLTKELRDVSMLDLKEGKPVRVKQWIPVIEGSVDMTTLMIEAPMTDDSDEEPDDAIAVLQGPVSRETVIEGEIMPRDDDEPAQATESDDGAPTVEELQESIKACVAGWKGVIPWGELNPYLDETYGDWKTDSKKLAQILDKFKAAEESGLPAFRKEVTKEPF